MMTGGWGSGVEVEMRGNHGMVWVVVVVVVEVRAERLGGAPASKERQGGGRERGCR
jgi:hypothetical protein